MRLSGGSGGHNGMKSIIEQLGTRDFPRMRLGIEGDTRGPDTARYVLSDFEPDELDIVDDMIERALAAVRMTLRRGLGTAMNHYNRKPTPDTKADADASEAAIEPAALSDKESPE